MRSDPRLGWLAFLLALIVVIAAQNSGITTVWFLFWPIKTSKIVVIFLSSVLGFLAGLLAVPLIKKRR